LEEKNSIWLFDCGEATQHQILHTSLKPRKIEKIFITHLHGDHIFGLPGLLGSRSFQGGATELTIYGPKGIREYVDVSLKISQTHLKYPLTIIEIEDGVIFEDDQFTVETLLLDHGIPSYGFRIIEKDKKGTLDAERLHSEGILAGPIYKLVKKGEMITLEDGRVINGNDYLGPDLKGRVLCILGDTRPCDNAYILASEADVIVHEATFSADSEEMARDYFHSTTAQAARLALKAKAHTLYLNHISSRYIKENWNELEEEARAIFPNTKMTYDFLEMTIAPHKN